jgi:hypothetical protein
MLSDMNTTTYARAKKIMGELCVGPETISQTAPRLTKMMTRSDWSTVPFSEEILASVGNSHVLVAGCPLTLVNMDNLYLENFFISGYRNFTIAGERTYWFASESFAKTQRVDERWYLFRTDPVPESFYAEAYIDPKNLELSAEHGMTLKEQLELIEPWERVPHACEVAYLALICKLLWGLNLFPFYVRTCDTLYEDGRVVIGYIEQRIIRNGKLYRIGMDIDEIHDEDRRHRVGIASEIIPA